MKPPTLPFNRFCLTIAVIFSLTLSTTSCGIGRQVDKIADASDRAVSVLDDGIAALSEQSSQWQETLQDMRSKLTDDAQKTIRNEITELLTRSIAAVGSEIKCLVDFAGARVKQALISIRDSILGSSTTPREPVFCDSIPRVVEQERIPASTNALELYGYDFDRTAVQVLLVKSSGTVDVSDKLDMPTHYHMTLNLGANGVQLPKDSQRFLIRWNGRDISTIAIIGLSPKVCRLFPVKLPASTLGSLTNMPPLTRGDREFEGHGPQMDISVKRSHTRTQISMNLFVSARETGGRDTRAAGDKKKRVYIAPANREIDQVLGPARDDAEHLDGGHDEFEMHQGGGGPVSRYLINGDRKGDDAGVFTQVTAFFNGIEIVLKEKGNCVSATEVRTAIDTNQLSQAALQTLRPQLDALPRWAKSLPPIVGNVAQ